MPQKRNVNREIHNCFILVTLNREVKGCVLSYSPSVSDVESWTTMVTHHFFKKWTLEEIIA